MSSRNLKLVSYFRRMAGSPAALAACLPSSGSTIARAVAHAAAVTYHVSIVCTARKGCFGITLHVSESRFNVATMKTESDRRSATKWMKNNPLKHAAHVILATAVKRGKMHKQPCEICGKPNTHGHHDDYTQPLTVRWLCAKHHKEAHGIFRKVRTVKPRTIPKRESLYGSGVALRSSGKSYRAIASELGLSTAQTYKMLNPTTYD